MQADLGLVHMKIQEIVQILTNFKSQPQEKSRSAYIDELSDLVTTYYEYNKELADYFVSLFAPAELVNFLEASQAPRPMVIRTNTMRTKRRELAQVLIQKGVNLDPAGDWNKIGLKIIDSQVPIGATTEYLAGQYMLQSASSFLPVMALAPKPGERVLDLCAAPGGKTTHIGQIMKNSGVIVANEMNPDRVASIKGNVHRMGFTNVIITNYDGRKIGKHLCGFDRALVDAPCSGLGVIWKDPSVKAMRTLKDIKRNAHIQKELLLSGIDAVNAKSSTGGFIVYSTCSVSIEENEEVINYALKNRKVKLVDTGLTLGEPGMHKFKGKIFHPSMILCKRIYPHVYNMEGFFIAKLKKIENNIAEEASRPHSGVKRDRKNKIRKNSNDDSDDYDNTEKKHFRKGEKNNEKMNKYNEKTRNRDTNRRDNEGQENIKENAKGTQKEKKIWKKNIENEGNEGDDTERLAKNVKDTFKTEEKTLRNVGKSSSKSMKNIKKKDKANEDSIIQQQSKKIDAEVELPKKRSKEQNKKHDIEAELPKKRSKKHEKSVEKRSKHSED